MLFQDIIRKKRDGGALNAAEIAVFVQGLSDETLPAEQVAALAMAMFLRGLSRAETGALTRAMAASGATLDWGNANLPGPVLDKHSTGGVGDKTSFLIAPIIAACGGAVPMISGRGLGHTGGTVDKLEAIPGYETGPDRAQFKRVVEEIGCAIIGQTTDLAPADRRLYAIRDVTGTVESIPLITASILSKKHAAGLEALILDVKTGSGAFMPTRADAEALAASLVETAGEIGLSARALLSDMSQVLGDTAGNALEIAECVAFLTGARREPRLEEATLALCAELLELGGLANSLKEARAKAEAALQSGQAAERFARMVAALGGPKDLLERPGAHLAPAPVQAPVLAEGEGRLGAVNVQAIGNALIELGGGRRRLGDSLDFRVGFSECAPIGAAIDRARPLAIVHAASAEAAAQGAAAYAAACRLLETAQETPVVLARITAAGG